jgi:Ser-tRNA(Ala) deacylase AlaX
VTALSPFYAESGGQVGDTGTITKPGGAIFEVTDTQRPIEGLIVHRGEHIAGALAVGDEVLLEVNGAERALTRKNHSATHLLHHALRGTLGDHVKQRGSLVGPHRLRFDFSHFGPLTAAEIQTIEREVNARIVKNVATDTALLGKEEAVARGAIAFFGDKYGETVRVLTIGGDSVELCGGTHVRATGDIGLFKIVSDSALAAGVRRVEGVTGLDALEYVAGLQRTLHDLGTALDVIDIRAADGGWYDYAAKYTKGGSIHILPADLKGNIYQHIQQLALTAHRALGCRGVSRSDFRYDDRPDGTGELVMLEVNTQPGMTETSLVPELAAHAGMSFGELVRWMVEDASCDR